MNILDKSFLWIVNSIGEADNYIMKKTGKGLFERMGEASEKEEKLRNEKPLLWASKKLLIGTIKGITGASLHND